MSSIYFDAVQYSMPKEALSIGWRGHLNEDAAVLWLARVHLRGH
jgi:hypothetical protein